MKPRCNRSFGEPATGSGYTSRPCRRTRSHADDRYRRRNLERRRRRGRCLSDGVTDFAGAVSAIVAGLDNLGGFAEVSGKAALLFRGLANTGGGQLLLDLFNYIIGVAEAANIAAALNKCRRLARSSVRHSNWHDAGTTGQQPCLPASTSAARGGWPTRRRMRRSRKMPSRCCVDRENLLGTSQRPRAQQTGSG